MKLTKCKLSLAAMLLGVGMSFGQINSSHQVTNNQSNSTGLQLFDSPMQPTSMVYSSQDDVSKRSINAKHYKNSDGSYTAVVSAGPLHYKKGGRFLDIDMQVVAQGDNFVNKANFMETTFPKHLVDGVNSTTTEGSIMEFVAASMYWEVNNQPVSMRTANPSATAQAQGNQVVYEDVFGGVSARYTVLAGKRKLDFVIAHPGALADMPAGATHLVFAEGIQLPNGWTHTTTAQGVNVMDTKGKVIYRYDNPTTNDAKDYGLFNDNSQISTNQIGNLLVIKVKVDVEWLKSADRVYPITVDPTVSVYPLDEDFWTIQVNSAGGGQSGLPAAGRASTGTWYRGFITFDTASLPASTINDAQIVLTTANLGGTINSTYPIGISQSKFDVPIWTEYFSEIYDYITHSANSLGEYAIVENPAPINSSSTYNLGNAARADIARNTGGPDAFFSVSVRQGWIDGPVENHYVVYYGHEHGINAPTLILNYTQSDDYCHPAHIYANCAAIGDCEYIGISNVSLGSLNAPTTYDHIPIGYNQINGTTTLLRTMDYSLNVTYKDNGVPYNPGKLAAWIDWNGDGQFSAGEFLGVSGNMQNGQTHSFTFTVPITATLGETRMRVRSVYFDESLGANDACASKEYGETEDYTITIEKNSMGVNDLNKNEVEIYPNPTSDFVYIQSQSAIELVQIYNLNGQLVLTTQADQINLTHLPKGDYIIKVKTKEGKELTKKLIKK